jgi:hypothetical protein
MIQTGAAAKSLALTECDRGAEGRSGSHPGGVIVARGHFDVTISQFQIAATASRYVLMPLA